MRDVASDIRWRDGAWGERIAKQMARELMLLESSDWQFLITTAAARDYAEKRFNGHLHQFVELEMLWAEFVANGALSQASERRWPRWKSVTAFSPRSILDCGRSDSPPSCID